MISPIGDGGRRQKHIRTVAKCGYRLIGGVCEIPLEQPAVTSSLPAPSPALPTRRFAFLKSGYSRLTASVAGTVVFAATFLAGSGIGAGHRERPAGAASSSSKTDTGFERGRYAWNLQARSRILQAPEFSRNAIAEDCGYARAWAGFAECHVSLPSYSHNLSQPDLERARAAAQLALEIAPDLAGSHLAQGIVFMIGEHRFAEAEGELRGALRRDPEPSLAQGEPGLFLVASGKAKEAIENTRLASQLDPLSIRAAADPGIVLCYARYYKEARAQFEEVLKPDPYSCRAHVNLGKTYMALGNCEEARSVFPKASFLSDHDPVAEGLLAEAAAGAGDPGAARAIAGSMEQQARKTHVAPGSLAYAYMGLADYGRALENLREAYDDRTIAAIFPKVDPNWEALRSEPEFRLLTKDLP